jgi:hypothetical protein
MSTPETPSAIMARIERAIQRVVEAVDRLAPADMLEPRFAGGRSVKDILGHLTWWDQWLLVTLPADPDTPLTPITLPLADAIPSRAHWADEMNARVHAYNQPRALSDIQAEFTTTRNDLLRRVSRLSHDDLYNPEGIAATIGQPVAPLICGIYEHYQEHAEELEHHSP